MEMLSYSSWIFAKFKAKLTYHASCRVHLSTANGRQAAEENVQLIGGHLTRQSSAEDLCDHTKHHHTTRTEAVPGEKRELRLNKSFHGENPDVYLLFEQMMCQNAAGEDAK